MSNPIGFELFAKDRASETFDKLTTRIKAAQKTTDEWKVGAIAGAAGVGVAVVEFGKQSVEAYTESQKAQTLLTDAYRRFPGLADVSLEKLKALAEQTQEKTKFDHNAAMAAEATLAQYHLTGKQIEQMLPLVADYAAKTGKTLPEAALDTGRALLGNTRALKDIGIDYHRAALAAQLHAGATGKAGKASGSFTDALNKVKTAGVPLDFLMTNMRKQLGGYAEREAKDATDQTVMLQHNYDDLKEKIGAGLLPVLQKLLVVGLGLSNWITHHSTLVKVFLVVLGTYIAFSKAAGLIISLNTIGLKALVAEQEVYKAALIVGGAVGDTYNAVMAFGTGVMTGVREATQGMTAAELAQAAATRGLTVVTGLLSAAWRLSPVGMVTTLILALAAGLIYAYKHSETFRTIVNETWHAVSTGAQFMWNNVLKPTFRFLLDYWLTIAGGIVHGAAFAFGWVPGLGPKLKSAARFFDTFKADVNRSLGGITSRTVSVGVTFKAGTALSYDLRHQGMAAGGVVPMDPGAIPGQDSVIRALMPGEFVIRRDGSNMGAALAHFGHGMAGGGLVISDRFPSMSSINRSDLGAIAALSHGLGPALLGGVGGGSGSGVSRWAQVVLTVLSMLGQPATLLAGVLRRINLESGGNPNAINLWDSNALAGHPSMGLMQTIMSTFLSYSGPFRGLGITNPLANVYAGLNYALHRYGSIGAIDPLVRPYGYDRGGYLMPGLSLAYNGTGHPEPIVPPGAGRVGGGAVVVQLVIDKAVVQSWLVDNGRATRAGLLKERRAIGNAKLGFDS